MLMVAQVSSIALFGWLKWVHVGQHLQRSVESVESFLRQIFGNLRAPLSRVDQLAGHVLLRILMGWRRELS